MGGSLKKTADDIRKLREIAAEFDWIPPTKRGGRPGLRPRPSRVGAHPCFRCGTLCEKKSYQNSFICDPCRRERDNEYKFRRRREGVLKEAKGRSEYTREYEKRPEVKARRAWKKRNDPVEAMKEAARKEYHNALRWGRIKKGACEVCGDPDVHAHHDDYSKPLDVRWLCQTHHIELHAKLRTKGYGPNIRSTAQRSS